MTQSELKIRQALAWLVFATFVCGFFWGPVGAWTGPIMGVWFIGTQRIRPGFLWILAIGFVPLLCVTGGCWERIPAWAHFSFSQRPLSA